jgi:8-oxo-dGTP pyrophosphatase MutT (NUDIX family)
MIREAKEEAGITIAREDLEIIQVMHRRTAEEERIDYFFLCEEWEGEIKNIEPHKCDKLSWCSLENLPQNTIGYINAAIENYQDEIRFSIFGW